MLICFGWLTILMDSSPIHRHEIVNLGYDLKPKFYTDAIIVIKELPNIDFILSYHFHGDHFDQDAERELDTPLLIVTASHVAKQLRNQVFQHRKIRETRYLNSSERRRKGQNIFYSKYA